MQLNAMPDKVSEKHQTTPHHTEGSMGGGILTPLLAVGSKTACKF